MVPVPSWQGEELVNDTGAEASLAAVRMTAPYDEA
jgi:hypothetical protein